MELSVFNNEKFGEIRSMMIDGEVWFVASDIARILEYRNAPDMTRYLDDDEVNTTLIKRSKRGNPNVTIINESGLYHAVIISRKDSAKAFRKWVTSEVLPSIRKTGSYDITKKHSDEYKKVREQSKNTRIHFTDMLKAHGYNQRDEYIKTTMQMKNILGISAKKNDMDIKELATVSASEWLSIAMIADEKGYQEVNPVCVKATKKVNLMIEETNYHKELA